MIEQILHLVFTLDIVRDTEVQTERLVRGDNDVLARQRRHTPQLVFSVVDVHREHAVRLRLQLVLPLGSLSIGLGAVREVEK